MVRKGRVTGYATDIGFFGHAVAETTEDLKALDVRAETISGPGLSRAGTQLRALTLVSRAGAQIVQPMTLMSIGDYHDPQGAFLPSVLY